MLRLIVLILLLANGAYFAWSRGLLMPWGLGPAQQAEPQRLAQQVRPDAVRVLPADEFKRLENAAAAAPRAPECLASPLLDETRLASVRTVLESWPAGSWTFDQANEPARWILYMGRYPGVEQVARKRAELRQLGVSFEPLANPDLEPGLSLGGFATQQAATQQLESLAARGVRTAKVVQERAEQRGTRLMLPAVDEVLRQRLEELKPVLGGRPLRPCR
jgi:hypothetical protein